MIELKIPPPVLALIMAASMWGCQEPLNVITFELENKLTICLWLAALGLLVDACALWLFMWARTTVNPIKPNKATALVTSGIYRYTRNPMYVGNFIFLTAWLIWLGSPLNVVFLIFYVLYMNRFQISVEERILSEKFGEEYAQFCQSVRRWI
ncbi:MAG: hypothetical protein A6F70_01935 [Cycloclasticus sp. symbiont of Bathymodiolus heckerae]|nr:MAG: hypothetical protein A6F70_01935 [Cycloclasticus sp. symbiont of Bathymodiolus heckerae]